MTTPDPTNAGFPYAPINEPAWGIPHDEQTALLRAPLAGIELGTYDERILTWIVDTCDTPTVAVIASLLHRARAARPLPAADTATEPRFDLTTSSFSADAIGAGGGQQILRNLTAAQLDNKLAEHGVGHCDIDNGNVTVADGLKLSWRPANTKDVQP